MSDFFLKGTVGNGRAGVQDQTEVAARMGRLGDLITSNLNGFYYEQAKRGNKFSMVCDATTTGAAAGQLNAAAAAASTQFALWNPVGSGVDLVLQKVFFGLISGTVVGGPPFHSLMLNGIPTISATFSAGRMNNMLPGGAAPKARGVAHAAGTALTGGGALTTLRPMGLTYSAGTYAALAGSAAVEVLDGEIVIPEGYGWVPTLVAAGTSVLNVWGVTWDEVAK
jgi:hypothetical protein